MVSLIHMENPKGSFTISHLTNFQGETWRRYTKLTKSVACVTDAAVVRTWQECFFPTFATDPLHYLGQVSNSQIIQGTEVPSGILKSI